VLRPASTRDEHLERSEDGELLLGAAADLLCAEDGGVVDDHHRGRPLPRREREHSLHLGETLLGPRAPQDGREQFGPVRGQAPGVLSVALPRPRVGGLAGHPRHEVGLATAKALERTHGDSPVGLPGTQLAQGFGHHPRWVAMAPRHDGLAPVDAAALPARGAALAWCDDLPGKPRAERVRDAVDRRAPVALAGDRGMLSTDPPAGALLRGLRVPVADDLAARVLRARLGWHEIGRAHV